MSITTMEQLQAMPTGSEIRVAIPRIGNRTFVRTETGFSFEGTEVDPDLFIGHVTAGQVSDHTNRDPEPGDLFVSGRHHYLTLSLQDGRVWLMQFARGQYTQTLSRSLADCQGYAWTRVGEADRPPWYQVALALGTLQRSQTAEVERLNQQVAEYAARVRTAEREAATARQTRAAQVQVVATGVSRMPPEKADGHVPEKVTVVDVVASWRREFTITGEPSVGCQCGTVTREMVADLLGIEANADFGFQTNCGRH